MERVYLIDLHGEAGHAAARGGGISTLVCVHVYGFCVVSWMLLALLTVDTHF